MFRAQGSATGNDVDSMLLIVKIDSLYFEKRYFIFESQYRIYEVPSSV